MNVFPVILAGGSGSRLWPLSRTQYPKQFLELVAGGKTLLQATLDRLIGLDTSPPLLICNEAHRFLAAEQLRAMGCEDAEIILEPCARNTAPAIALAALRAMQNDDDAILLILAADHFIPNTDAFQACISSALPLARDGKLVTCGVVPSKAETGYGYIERGTPLGESGAYSVIRFVEKPNLIDAQSYLKNKNFLWNSGMFVFKASRYLQELKKFNPDVLNACQAAMHAAKKELPFIRVNKEEFERSPSDSIDYAVMEKTADAVVVPIDAGWSDVGSWSALWEVSDKEVDGNVLRGDSCAYESTNTFIHADSRLVAVVGVHDLIIVETKDAVMVAHKDKVQDVKKIVEKLKKEGRSEYLNHREVYRPWGVYDSVDRGDRYQVKRITVNPGAKLSVQMHHHRAEHWIVVSGTAQITNGEKTYLLTENQSTYIPIGQVHALENPGKIPLELIEVQSGAYLGEDDIVRFEDRYGRS